MVGGPGVVNEFGLDVSRRSAGVCVWFLVNWALLDREPHRECWASPENMADGGTLRAIHDRTAELNFLLGGGRYPHSEERRTTGLVALVLKTVWEVKFSGDAKERGHRDDRPDEVGLRLLTAVDQAGSMRFAANPKGRRP